MPPCHPGAGQRSPGSISASSTELVGGHGYGSSPAQPWRVRECYVLTLFLTVPLSSAISLCSLFLTRGALARRRSVEAGTVLWCSLASCIDGRPWRGAGRGLGPGPPAWPPWASAKPVAPVRLKKPCAKRHSGSCLHHHTASRAAQRATLDYPQARSSKLRAHRCWLCDRPADESASSRTAAADPGSQDQPSPVIPGLRSRARDPYPLAVQKKPQRLRIVSSVSVVVLDPRLRRDDSGERPEHPIRRCGIV